MAVRVILEEDEIHYLYHLLSCNKPGPLRDSVLKEIKEKYLYFKDLKKEKKCYS